MVVLIPTVEDQEFLVFTATPVEVLRQIDSWNKVKPRLNHQSITKT